MSIGVVSPFRVQADAISDRLLSDLPAKLLETQTIEVGTVHAFQGAEFDLVIVSLALTNARDRAWQWVNQRHLFNVMVTRARQRVVVVTSVAEPPGLAGEYLRYGATPPNPAPAETTRDTDWAQRVAHTLTDAGHAVQFGYRVGSHVIDLVLRDADAPTAIICEPDPDGPAAHLERDLVLRRLGWVVVHAFRSRWEDELTISVSTLTPGHDPAGR